MSRLKFMFIPLLFAGIAGTQIVTTYHVFTQTSDEPAHLAAGMEWLDKGTYTYNAIHPPLARIAIAFGPYWDGIRSIGHEDKWREGNSLLDARGAYFHNLSLARLGVLPFFFFATGLVWVWSRTLFGELTAILATILFTTLPPILGHSGLATTDMAITATFLGAIIAFACWLERPTFWRSVMLGVAAALAILSKFSALPFLFASGLALLALRWKKVQNRLSLDTIRGWSAPTVSVIFAASLVIWAVYGFTTGSLVVMKERDIRVIDRFAGDRGVLHNIAHAVVEAPFIPAPQFFRGIGAVAYVNKEGRDAYLLGKTSRHGWWYFFPVALAFKSPLPFLILTMIAFAVFVMQSWRGRASPLLVPGIVAAAVLIVCIFSRVNIGLRHILPIYPFLAIVAGFGASSLWKARRFNLLARGAVVGLILWQCASSAYAHPDYLAYFNEMAGRHPERILIDSDLDWGQDVKRLADTLIAYGIREISVSYLGGGALERHGPFTVRKLVPHERASGWIAVSEFQLRVRDGFSWLQAYKPVSLVGRSIRLYYIPAVVTAH